MFSSSSSGSSAGLFVVQSSVSGRRGRRLSRLRLHLAPSLRGLAERRLVGAVVVALEVIMALCFAVGDLGCMIWAVMRAIRMMVSLEVGCV